MKKLITVIGAVLQTDKLTKKSYVVLKLPLATFDPNAQIRRKRT